MLTNEPENAATRCVLRA